MSEITTDDGSAPPISSLREHCEGLEFDQRQEFLGGLNEAERTELIEGLSQDTRERWATEELKHLQALVDDQQVEGAEFGQNPGEEVRIDGADEPQDRAPDVGAELIATLVKERVAAEQAAAKATREGDEARAEVQAYYERFGPLAS